MKKLFVFGVFTCLESTETCQLLDALKPIERRENAFLKGENFLVDKKKSRETTSKKVEPMFNIADDNYFHKVGDFLKFRCDINLSVRVEV